MCDLTSLIAIVLLPSALKATLSSLVTQLVDLPVTLSAIHGLAKS
jgi:hypothetical protein